MRRHLDAHRRRRLLGDERRIGEPSEVDEPGAVRELREQSLGGGDREARLPGTARAGEREQPFARQEPADLCELAVAADEARQLHRQPVLRRRLF